MNLWTAFVVPGCVALLISVHAMYKILLSTYVSKSFVSGRKASLVIKKYKLRSPAPSKIEAKYGHRTKCAWLTVLAVFAFIIAMAHFESKGKREALNIKEEIQLGKSSLLSSKSELKKNFTVVFCGSRNCAAIDKTLKHIKYFPQNGHSTTEHEKI